VTPAPPRWPGALDTRFAAALNGRHPAVVFAAALIVGWVLVAALSIGLGLLVTDEVVPADGVASADQSFVESLVDERTPFLTDVSTVGSTVGSYVLVGVAILTALFFAHRRQWVLAAYAAFLPMIESSLYRITSAAAPRQRPDVPRLEDLPVDASYPSGHTAASIAVYGGLVLLLTTRISSPRRRLLAWVGAILIAVFVAMSRMYRGMHHPIDAVAGVLVGVAAIALVLLACNAAVAAIEMRRPATASEGESR
jgi:membrane-associated phospholipid phosphatase